MVVPTLSTYLFDLWSWIQLRFRAFGQIQNQTLILPENDTGGAGYKERLKVEVLWVRALTSFQSRQMESFMRT